MIDRTIKNKPGQVVAVVAQLFFVAAIILLIANIAQAPTHAEAQAICYKTVTDPTTLAISTIKTDCTTGAVITDTTTPSSGSVGGDSQDLFKFINESPDSSTGNQGTPATSGAGSENSLGNETADTGIHSLDQVQGLGDAQTANTFTCGGSASGGSVANTLAGLGVNPSSVIACINGGSSCPGLAGNLAGNVLAQQAGKLGIPPGLAGTALGVVSGNTSPTQAILGLAAQKAPAILQALFGGKGGGAASAVGSALHSGAANSIGGIAGGAIGGIAGGVIGGITGGGSVPVDVTTKDLLKNIAATRQFTEGLHTKETCTDGIASTLSGKITSDWVKATADFANKQSITNWYDFASTVDKNVFEEVVGGIDNPDLKKLLFDTYEEDTSPNKILQSRNTPTKLSPLEEFEATFIKKTDPTLLSQYVNEYDSFVVQRTAAGEAIDRLGIADGLRSQVVCIGKDGTETEGLIETCPNNFRVATPASVISDQFKNAVAAGQKQVADVDEVTDNVNPFLAQLFQQALPRIGGLFSLFERGSAATPAPNVGGGRVAPRPNAPGPDAASGDTGAFPGDAASGDSGVSPGGGVNDFGNNSSYLDQVAGTAENTSIASARSFLTRNVSLSIAAEESYQRTLADMVQDVAFAAGAFDRVRLCYVDLTKNISTGISTATALEKANQASSTIAAIFVPQIERRVTEIAASEIVVGELVRIAGLAREANTADELNAVSDSFDALLSAGLVHSETDLIFLENDRAAAAVALQQVASEADSQLAECQQF